MLYGSEIWGLSSPACMEAVQIYACKQFLNVKMQTCNDVVLGDLGRYPMFIQAHKRCIKYWLRLVNLSNDRYSKLCYNMLLYYDNNGYENWVSCVKHNLYQNGFGYVWESQGNINQKLY